MISAPSRQHSKSKGFRISFGCPLIDGGEMVAVRKVLEGKTLTNGGQVAGFEEEFAEFCGGGMAVATTSCFTALYLSCLVLLRPGQEVIVPALTHPATALAPLLIGCKPIFMDCDEFGNLKIDESKITKNTRAIIPVHYLGRPVDFGTILPIARKHNLLIIEDCALAIGSHYEGRHVGLIGDVGCFSFYPVKHITTGEGGMVLTKNPQIAEAILQARHFGQKFERTYGAPKPLPEVVSLGMNARMTEMQAAMGRVQLKKLPFFLDMRRRNYAVLNEGLKEFEKVESNNTYGMSVYVPNSRKVRSKLKKQGVELSVYYDRPVPKMPIFNEGTFPNAERICAETLCFPVGPHLQKRHMHFMIEAFKCALS